MRKWRVIIALASAQFVMVLDGTVMNVSINEVVQDLDTTVSKMQLAITLYTLTMASLMLVGGKIGDVIGRRRAFRIGLVVFASGAGITALSPNITVLMIGWSILEGMGAALMIPAIAALVAGNYKGRDRAAAYGVIGGIAGAAAASGPIIGGYVSTEFSWRYVFGAEVFIMLGILVASVVIKQAPFQGRRPRLDWVGAGLSISGLGLAVLGAVQSTDWGWIEPKGALTIAGTEITPFGLSAVPFLILIGIALLGLFARWEQRQERLGRDTLLSLDLLKIPQLRAGLSMFLAMFMILAGTFFVLPLYLEIVLGKDPLQTGIQLLPLSVGLFVVALGAAKLSTRFSPKQVVRTGLFFLLVGTITLLASINQTLDEPVFLVAMALVGIGLGLLASQLGNVNLSSVDSSRSSEAGGLQGTSQFLGSALGTAVIGSILLTGLGAAFTNDIANNPEIPAKVRTEISNSTQKGIPFIAANQVEREATKAGLPSDEARAAEDSYEDAQLTALKTALLGVMTLVVIAFWFTRHLPSRPMAAPPAAAA
jgi:MFS family permease